MQRTEDLSIPYMPVHEQAFFNDPVGHVEIARRTHPWLARFDAGYVVHGYQAFKDLIFMDDKLQPGLGGIIEFYEAQGTPWAKFMDEMLINATGERHTRLRASIAEAFTPRRAYATRDLMRKVVSDLLDEWTPKGQFDFAEFASYFPVAVMCGVLGVSPKKITGIRDALETHMTSLTLNKAIWPQVAAAYDVIWNFADEAVKEREQSGGADGSLLIDALIASRNEGKMDETELRFMIMVLTLGGYDTSKNMLAMTVYRILQHPGMWERCAQDKEYCDKVVEEALRHSSIATFFRSVAQDFEYDSVQFKKGSMVVFATPLTGQDPSAFDDPKIFDPEGKPRSRHLAFGRGTHICPGQFLARTQIEEGLHLVAQRLRNARIVGDVTWRPFLAASGPQSLPLAFDQAKPGTH